MESDELAASVLKRSLKIGDQVTFLMRANVLGVGSRAVSVHFVQWDGESIEFKVPASYINPITNGLAVE